MVIKKRLSNDEKLTWHNSLPFKRCAAHMLCWDDKDNLLFVLHDYEDWWGFPGGVVEENESPLHAALREVEEETGLNLFARRIHFVGIDYAHHNGEWKDFVHFYFNAGVLSAKDIKQLGERAYSLHSCQFLNSEQIIDYVNPQRMGAVKAMFEKGERIGVYLETKLT